MTLRAGGGLPPEVATDFDVITIGRSIRGGSSPGGRRAAHDGSPDEEPIVDAVDANVNAPTSSSICGAPGAADLKTDDSNIALSAAPLNLSHMCEITPTRYGKQMLRL